MLFWIILGGGILFIHTLMVSLATQNQGKPWAENLGKINRFMTSGGFFLLLWLLFMFHSLLITRDILVAFVWGILSAFQLQNMESKEVRKRLSTLEEALFDEECDLEGRKACPAVSDEESGEEDEVTPPYPPGATTLPPPSDPPRENNSSSRGY